MFKKRLIRWSQILASTTFMGLAIPGCDAVTGIFEQVLQSI
jgi:hypothetical protein